MSGTYGNYFRSSARESTLQFWEYTPAIHGSHGDDIVAGTPNQAHLMGDEAPQCPLRVNPGFHFSEERESETQTPLLRPHA
jgi:hypothetical protein